MRAAVWNDARRPPVHSAGAARRRLAGRRRAGGAGTRALERRPGRVPADADRAAPQVQRHGRRRRLRLPVAQPHPQRPRPPHAGASAPPPVLPSFT